MGKRILTEAQLQARREYNKRYRESHKEIEQARVKRFRETNPDKIKEAKARYRDSHKEQIAEYNRNHYVYHPIVKQTPEEKKAKRIEKYIESFVPKEKICRYCGSPFMTEYRKSKVFCSEDCRSSYEHYLSKLAAKRRHGKITALDRLDSDITLPKLYKRDKGICKICGGLCEWGDKTIVNDTIVVGYTYPSIDHIVPISKGGTHTWDNVQLAHKYCNTIKSDKET